MASLGVLNPKPMLFQNRFPPFPGLFPFELFLELHKTTKTYLNKNSQKHTLLSLNSLTKSESKDKEHLRKENLGLLQKRLLSLQQ